MKKGLLLLIAVLGLFVFVACGDDAETEPTEIPAVTEVVEETETEIVAETETETEVTIETETETEVVADDETEVETESVEAAYHELVSEWSYLGTAWFRFYPDGSAVNLQDGEAFTWEEDGSINAILYESWSVSGDTLTITWSTGVSFSYSRIAGTATASVDTGDYQDVVGEWSYFGTPWFRFNADGTAENLSDGERFRWHEDGSISDAILYESWSVRGNTLTITWSTGVSFSYSRD